MDTIIEIFRGILYGWGGFLSMLVIFFVGGAIVILIMSLVNNCYDKIDSLLTKSKYKKMWNRIKNIVIAISIVFTIIAFASYNIKSCIKHAKSSDYEEPYIRGHGH